MSSEASEADEASTRADQTFQAGSEDDFDSEGDAEAGEVQPGKKRRTLTTEGGGSHCAPLNDLGFKLRYDLGLDRPRGHVAKATFHIDGEESVVVHRPEPGAPMNERLVWTLMERSRYQCYQNKELRTTISKAYELFDPFRLGMATGPGSGTAAPNGAAGCAAVATDGHDHVNFVWKVQKLPAHTQASIAGKFFLEIEDGTKDAQGNLYVPNGKQGSMCGTKFPHAVINVTPRGSKGGSPVPQYICGACNNVRLSVRLMKRVDGGNAVLASELEILNPIKKAHLQHQRDAWFDNEDRMQLYAYLEFADGPGSGTPVSPGAFKHAPAHGKLFTPPENAPYNLGETEFLMTQGRAHLTTNFAKHVAHANLKPTHKSRPFRFVVKVLNPFLVDVEGFTVRSLPFHVKSVLHNDVRTDVRYVKRGGEIVRAD
jgi:hypothetical protein